MIWIAERLLENDVTVVFDKENKRIGAIVFNQVNKTR